MKRLAQLYKHDPLARGMLQGVALLLAAALLLFIVVLLYGTH